MIKNRHCPTTLEKLHDVSETFEKQAMKLNWSLLYIHNLLKYGFLMKGLFTYMPIGV